MTNENDYECVPMKDELDESIKTREMDIPMPEETTTDKLMSPGSGKDVDG